MKGNATPAVCIISLGAKRAGSPSCLNAEWRADPVAGLAYSGFGVMVSTKRAARLVWLVSVSLLLTAYATVARAQDDSSTSQGGSPDWVGTPITDPVKQLFAPTSGALFACMSSGPLQRSDDAVSTARAVHTGPSTAIGRRAWTGPQMLSAT